MGFSGPPSVTVPWTQLAPISTVNGFPFASLPNFPGLQRPPISELYSKMRKSVTEALLKACWFQLAQCIVKKNTYSYCCRDSGDTCTKNCNLGTLTLSERWFGSCGRSEISGAGYSSCKASSNCKCCYRVWIEIPLPLLTCQSTNLSAFESMGFGTCELNTYENNTD